MDAVRELFCPGTLTEVRSQLNKTIHSPAVSFARIATLLVAFLCLGALRVQAQSNQVPAERLRIGSEIFADGMVLQRGVPIRVWGDARPHGRGAVTVTLERADGTVIRGPETVVADAYGDWRAALPAVADATAPGDELVLRIAGASEIEIEEVAVGEVWFVAGQSNVAKWSPASKGAQRLSNADVRTFKRGDWNRPGRFRRYVGEVAFAIGEELFRRYDESVTIGIIVHAVPGTTIRHWMPPQVLDGDFPLDIRERYSRKSGRPIGSIGRFWRKNHELVRPFPARGVLWWQGESDYASRYTPFFEASLIAFVQQWRAQWNQTGLKGTPWANVPNDLPVDLPFVAVLIPKGGRPGPAMAPWDWDLDIEVHSLPHVTETRPDGADRDDHVMYTGFQNAVTSLPQFAVVNTKDLGVRDATHPPLRVTKYPPVLVSAMLYMVGDSDDVGFGPTFSSMQRIEVADGPDRLRIEFVPGTAVRLQPSGDGSGNHAVTGRGVAMGIDRGPSRPRGRKR